MTRAHDGVGSVQALGGTRKALCASRRRVASGDISLQRENRMFKSLAVTACLLGAVGMALAAPSGERVMTASSSGYARAQYAPPGMPVTMSLRGGVMVAPRNAGLAGVDIAMPSASFIEGWEGRLDVDVIFKANFAEVSTIVPVTFSQVQYLADISGRSVYYGIGAGVLLGGKSKLVGKGLLGVELGSRIGAEANVIFSDSKTMVTLVGRLHL